MKHTGLTIFVAEDSLLYQQLLRRMLQSVPAETVFFTSGEKLLLQLPHTKPDLAILDYNLEGQLTGLDTLLAMRRRYPGMEAILFSTCTYLPGPENYQRYGYFEYIEKNQQGLYMLHQRVVAKIDQLHQ